MRVLCVSMRLIPLAGESVEMTEYAPWPERSGMWEADEYLDHDGARYRYVGCDKDVYVYRELRRTPGFKRDGRLTCNAA